MRDTRSNMEITLYLRTACIEMERKDSYGRKLPRQINKVIHVEIQTRLPEEVYDMLKQIVSGYTFREQKRKNDVS